ncbi:ABC transporter substrate-binding protein [Pedococcus sp. 5OH_020]|uniref:ABC transporter substrate-binding protein n=1 Tax=Pedococcus sp. 5OH_020 TaxID=2989814 RepID=UPI0022EA07C7|nr:extracellular solute-binding protein [Pedococcus sp. 5OH_020]
MARTFPRTALGLSLVALSLAACGAPPTHSEAGRSPAASATSAVAAGGMEALLKAAKKEGALNVIALPPDWANYGEMIEQFSAEYGIRVNSAQPDASSQDEVNAARQLAASDRAPDVFDLGASVALANTALFAPYRVASWEDVADDHKDPDAKWLDDYGGFMTIGYDANQVAAPTTIKDLRKPEYKGKVALNGDPTQASAALNGVVAAALGNGGSADDVAPGVEFFADLKKRGNFLPLDPTPATVESGQTAVVLDWDYQNAGMAKQFKGSKVDWRMVVPAGAVIGSYYMQAINKDAPHPAAARLWEEFLFSDKGQNIWLNGLARPVRADAMTKSGTIDAKAYALLPALSGTPVQLTTAQSDKAKAYVAEHWAQAVN